MTAPLRTKGRREAAASAERKMSAPVRSRDCVLLGLILVERLSLAETAVTLGLTTSQVRREYDAALARVRRSLAPLLGRAAALRKVS